MNKTEQQQLEFDELNQETERRYRALDSYQVLKARKNPRKRKLSAMDGLRSKIGHYRLDTDTDQALQFASDIIESLMNMRVAQAVIVRRALRFYFRHLVKLGRRTKSLKGKKSFYGFLDKLEAERLALYSAACQKPERH